MYVVRFHCVTVSHGEERRKDEINKILSVFSSSERAEQYVLQHYNDCMANNASMSIKKSKCGYLNILVEDSIEYGRCEDERHMEYRSISVESCVVDSEMDCFDNIKRALGYS